MSISYWAAAPACKRRWVFVALLLLVGCSDGSKDAGREALGPLAITYPSEGAVFAPEMPAPRFEWSSSLQRSWNVSLQDARGKVLASVQVTGDRWRPAPAVWQEARQAARAGELVFGVAALDDSRQAQVRFAVSDDPVDAPLFFREVNLPFSEAVKDPSHIRWRFGNISQTEPPPVVLTGMPVCANCHSFTDDGRTLAMDVDYANDKGSYAISDIVPEIVLEDDDIITWSDFRRDDGKPTFGLLSQVSPDGRYVISTVKDRSVFVARPDLAYSQLFFPVQGILAVYDRHNETFQALPGADDPAYVQSNPCWSPDGKTIVFARSRAHPLPDVRHDDVLLSESECRVFLEGRPFRFDLYAIPFNGGTGGEAQPLQGASGDDFSYFFPKYSPDGRWIAYCRARSYMLLQPDSELFLIPARGGKPRRLKGNTGGMNSWHSWSPNGRWLAFASKENGPFTQIWLSHIDPDGNSSPPVVLDRLTAPDRAANIPEFVNTTGSSLRRITPSFLDAPHWVRSGDAFRLCGDLRGAERAYRRALKVDRGNALAHVRLGRVLMQQDKLPEAARHLKEGLLKAPDSSEAHLHLGILRARQGRLSRAESHLRSAVELTPEDAEAHRALGFLYEQMQRIPEAMKHYERSVALAPQDARARLSLAMLLLRLDRPGEAANHLQKAVELKPDDPTLRRLLDDALRRIEDPGP